MADTESWWRRLRSELSDPVAGRTDRVSVRGPRLAGGTAIDRSRADQDAAVRLFSASGIPHALFYGGLSPCREAAAPPGDLGPRYTVTWRMGSDEWGVQDVYPYAEGGPVIHDAAVAFNPAARGGWFRPGHELPAVWAKLGLPSEAVARSVAAPAGAGAGSPGAPAGPESIAVAATRPVADGGPGDASPWLFGIGAVAVLATGGWLGIRWRRHGQPVSYRDDPPGNAG